jgi:hypothetical protein
MAILLRTCQRRLRNGFDRETRVGAISGGDAFETAVARG